MTVETTKLTLHLPKQHVDFAKKYAEGHGISVNDLIDSYIRRLQSPPGGGVSAELDAITGLLPSDVDVESEYRQHVLRRQG